MIRSALIRMISMTSHEYHKTANTFLDKLAEQLDIEIFDDMDHSEGVVTLTVKPDKVYVINKQSPNQQIWLSSPYSGPKRYEYDGKDWVNLTDQHKLVDLLSKELSEATSSQFKLIEE